ncbi:MAG: hypothetical protein GEU80_12965 [Dehalococcoidia bacterium]|nr:hypothetical protein [Dehalococcoidia bacterium]
MAATDVIGRHIPAVEPGPSTVARDSTVAAGWTVVSRGTGLVRVVVAAAVFGPTFFGNIFQSTNLLPNLMYDLMAGSLIASMLVPSLVRPLDAGDGARASRLAGQFLGYTLLALSVIGLVAVAAGPWLTRLLTLGVAEAEQGAARSVAGVLLLLLAPQVLLYGLAGVGAAVQQARGRFALAAGAPVLENAGIILTLLAMSYVYGTAGSVTDVSGWQLVMLGGGTTLSVAAHAAAQWFGAWRAGVILLPRLGRPTEELREIARLALPSMGSTALIAARLLAVIVVAGLLPGGVIAFQAGYLFASLPVAIIARPVSVALLPRLARLSGATREVLGHEYDRALGLTLALTIPAAGGLAVLAPALGHLSAAGNMANPEGVSLLVAAIAGLSLIVLGESAFEIARQASYAARDARWPLRATALRVALALPGIALGALAFDGASRLLVLGLSISVADVVSAFVLDRRVRSRYGSDGRLKHWVARDLGLAVVALACAGGGAHLVSTAMAGTRLGWSMAAVAGAATGLVLYLGGLWWRQAPEVTPLVPSSIMRARSAPRAPRSRRVPFEGTVVLLGMCAASTLAAAAVYGGPLVVAAGAAAAVFVATVRWPQTAGFAFIASMPFLAGIDRGSVVPLLRPNELVQLFLMAALAARIYLMMTAGYRPRFALLPLDRVMLVMAFFASVVPLLWMGLRGAPLGFSDVMATVPLWKYYALYVLMRLSITTVEQVRMALWLCVLGAVAVAGIAAAQSLGILGVRELLEVYWAPLGDAGSLSDGRGSTTLASPIATGDYLAFSLALALALTAVARGRLRVFTAGVAAILAIGTLGSAQFSGAIALGMVVLVVAWLTNRMTLLLTAGPLLAMAAIGMLWPALSIRVEEFAGGGWPQSWMVRWDNLTTFYLPGLADFGWLLGIGPDSVVRAPETWRDTIWLESGYLWLLWVGGLPLLIAFVAFLAVGLRSVLAVATSRRDAVGVAATGAAAALCAIAVLTVLDPHLTLRGAGDLTFVLLALSTVPLAEGEAARAPEHPPPRPAVRPESPRGVPAATIAVSSDRSGVRPHVANGKA